MFLKTIAFLIIFYYLFKFIGQLLFPVILRKAGQRMSNQQSGGGFYQETASQPEGKVTITKTQSQKSSKTNMESDGEYVDFEEVK